MAFGGKIAHYLIYDPRAGGRGGFNPLNLLWIIAGNLYAARGVGLDLELGIGLLSGPRLGLAQESGAKIEGITGDLHRVEYATGAVKGRLSRRADGERLRDNEFVNLI